MSCVEIAVQLGIGIGQVAAYVAWNTMRKLYHRARTGG